MPSLARPPRTGLKRAASAAPRASADAAPALPAGADPLHLRLRNHLRDEILQGRLAPLAQLPSEAELIARFEVSRITVRHALAALHAEGLITKVQGKGSFVAPPRLSPPQDRLRGLSESLGDADLVTGLTVATRRADEALTRDIAAAVEALRGEGRFDAIAQGHDLPKITPP